MSQVTFSVIVPVYNVENYLRQCVDSILAQENCDLEVILVDDGSTDASGIICDEYAENDFRVRVIHKENGGSSDARNVGVREAVGDYLLFIDSDDYIAVQSLQRISSVIAASDYPDIVFLECSKVYTDIKRCIPMNDGVTDKVNGMRGDALKEYIGKLSKYPASPCTKVIKRSFFCNNELYFKKGMLCEDLEWSVRVFLAAQSAAYCETMYYFYRQNRIGSNSNSPNPKMSRDILGIMEECRQLEEMQNNVSARYMIRSIMEYIFRFLCIHSLQMPKEERRDYTRRAKQCAYVLGTRKETVSKICAAIYRVLGVEMTGRLLCLYLKLRNKYNS